MKKSVRILAFTVCVLLANLNGWGQLVTYNFPAASSLVASSTAANITAGDVSLSSGTIETNITTGTYFPNEPYVEETDGWTATTQASAKSYQFNITAGSGYQFSITNISFRAYATAAGPSAFGFAIGSTDLYAVNAPSASLVVVNQSVSGQTGLTTATIKIQGWLNGSRTSSGAGIFKVDDIVISGTVSSTSSPSITLTTTSFISGGNFGNQCVSTNSSSSSYTVSGSNLGSTDIVITPPTGFQIKKSVDPVGSFSSSAINLTPSSGSVASTGIDVRFSPSSTPGTYAAANITHASGSASQNLSVQGVGVNTAPSVTTGSASGVNTTVATASATISSIGCSAITAAYGIEYSTTNNFTNGTGTQVVSTNLSAGAFSSDLGSLPSPALVANTQYYFKAYATNGGGIAYGSQANFYTLPPAPSVGSVSNLQSTSFRVNWTDITTGNQNENYRVEVYSNSSYTTLVNSGTTSGNATFRDITTGLSANTQYWYRVRAENSGGSGAWTGSVGSPLTVTTLPTPTTVSFSSSSATALENSGTYNIAVSISNPSSSAATLATIGIQSGNATFINGFTSQTLTFPAGSSASQNVVVTLTNNTTCDGDASIVFNFSSITGGESASASGTTNFTLTIDDDEQTVQALLNDNFEGGNLTNWSNATNWLNSTSTPITGTRSLQCNAPAVASTSHITYAYSGGFNMASGTTTWRFNMKNGAWDPAASSKFFVYLVANTSSFVSSPTIDGYVVGVNMNSETDDLLKLAKSTDNFTTFTPLVTSTLDWNSAQTVGVEITRTATGVWELKYDANGAFDNLVSAGTATNTDFAFNDFFGPVFTYSSTRSTEFWMDDISISQIACVSLTSNESDIVDNTNYGEIADPFNINVKYKDYVDNTGNTSTGKVVVMKLKLRDGGSDFADADLEGTELNSLTISVKNTSGTDRSSYLKRAVLTTSAGTWIAEGTISAGQISFSGLSGASVTCNDADGSGKDLHLRVSYNEANVTDNEKLVFKVTGATANPAKSTFAAADAGAAQTDNQTTNDRNRIEVVATALAFLQQPPLTVNQNATMSPSPSVEAIDVNGKRDLDYNIVVNGTSDGVLNTTPMPATPSLGIATFSSTIHTAAATGRKLTATPLSGSVTSVQSNAFDIIIASNPSDYFQSKQDGNWTNVNTWQSSPNATGPWSNATIAPSFDANTVTVKHKVTINSSVTVDQVVVANGGTLEYAGSTNNDWYLNNGTDVDLTVESGGKVSITATNQGLFYVSGSGNPSVLIKAGGMVEAQSIGNGESDGWASDEWTYDGINTYDDLIEWENGSVFFWNVGAVLSTSGITYFANTPNLTDKPILRFAGSASNHGGSSITVIYGIVEIETGKTLNWNSSGIKNLVFGFRGAGNMTQTSSSGQILIDGETAEIGGSGTVTLNATNGLKIETGSVTTLSSNKVFNTGPIQVSGKLIMNANAISGTYTAFTINANGTVTTKNANGLRSATGSLQSNSATYNFANTGATVDYDGTSIQNITNTHPYYHLNIVGSGDKSLVGNTLVNGDFLVTDLGAGLGKVKAATHTLTVNGDWLTDGVNAFDRGLSTVILGGTNKTIDGATDFYTLQINGNRSVANILANQVNVFNALNLQSGTFTATANGKVTLKSTATGTAYLDNFTSGFGGTYSGNLTVERHVSNTSAGYRDISSPVATTVADLADDMSISGQDAVHCWYSYNPYPNVQYYIENSNAVTNNYYGGWWSMTGGGNALSPLKGVAIRTGTGPYTIDLTGAPYNGPQSIGITHTATGTPDADGWNFVGNTYPSPIDWNDVTAQNSGLDAAYYAFNTTAEYNGNWSSWNGSTGTNGGTRNIASTQGFFIKKTAPGSSNFTMNNAVREAEATTVFHKSNAVMQDEIRLELRGNNNSDEIVAYTDGAATWGFDATHDAVKIPAGSTVYMSYKQLGKEYAINVIDEITETTELPLVIWAQDTGTYTFEATELNVTGYIAYLKDAVLNTLTDLTSTSSVTMPLNGQQTYEGRYSIVFEAVEIEEPSGIANINKDNIKIYSHQNIAVVERSTDARATITISNLIGQTIKEITTDSKRTEITLDNANAWYAVVKVKEANATQTGKVLIK